MYIILRKHNIRLLVRNICWKIVEIFLNSVVIDDASFAKRFNWRCVTRLEDVNIVFKNVHFCNLNFFLTILKKMFTTNFNYRGDGEKNGFKNTNVNLKSDYLGLFYTNIVYLYIIIGSATKWNATGKIFYVQDIIFCFQNFTKINFKLSKRFKSMKYTKDQSLNHVMLIHRN